MYDGPSLLAPAMGDGALRKSDSKERTVANPSPRPPKAAVPSSIVDGDGNPIHNHILLGIPPAERERLIPKLELQHQRTHHVLHQPGASVKSAYFCDTGLVSILSVLPDGRSVEVGLIGNEGFVGVPLLAGFRTSPTRAIAQISGTVFRIDAEALIVLLPACPILERKLQQFAQIAAMQVTQLAACNRLHDVNERLARWLLMSADRIDSLLLPLTQEFLGQMLGARRSSVTVAAGALAKAGLITYNRGDVKILDRPGLEESACECYGIMVRQVEEWEGQRK